MAGITGIIAEYNPFHNGHAYQLEQARLLTGCDFLVVVMSGDYVQRGAPAVFDKYTRARMALACGADLVLELPVACSCASAEFFASGAVSLLDGLGCVDFLCFGSESGDLQSLMEPARILAKESPVFQEALRRGLSLGLSFPAARKEAFRACASNPDILDLPNNILGIEYLKALLQKESIIKPVTIKRKGQGYHDTLLDSGFASASGIRRFLKQEEAPLSALPALKESLPDPVMEVLTDTLAHTLPVWEEDFSMLLRYELLRQSASDLTRYADISPDLGRRLKNCADKFSSFSEFVALVKTKDVTYTRITRALFHILLNLTGEDTRNSVAMPYARILGFRKDHSRILGLLKENSRIPIIPKAADYKTYLTPDLQPLFEKDLFAANLYETIAAAKQKRAFLHDLKRSPVILS
ncbi:MAG: nucleotidyltransferase [Firmicutes bacterium]|nr:nucleotidyltransferase [Bacillota bacterium]